MACTCTHSREDHVTYAIDRTGQAWGVSMTYPTVCKSCSPMVADHGYRASENTRRFLPLTGRNAGQGRSASERKALTEESEEEKRMTIAAQPGTVQTARAFIRRIRNPRKQAYAIAYLHYLTLENGAEPEHEDYQPLSYMAMQGVRMQLSAILSGNPV